MKNLTWQNPEQLFVAQELINKVKSKCCGIKDILTGKEVKSCLNIEYCETEEIDQSLIIVNEGKQPESAVDVNTENKNVVVQNITVNGDVVLKKETNIGTNYGPNIEHNGGTLKLPKEK